MVFRYHFLFVGVNNGIAEEARLWHAQRDAQRIAWTFRDLGLGGGEPEGAEAIGVVTTLVGDEATYEKIGEALSAVRTTNDCDLLLIYWAGHLLKETRSLVTTSTLDANATHTQVSLGALAEAIFACRAKDRVLLLDACYAAQVETDILDQLRRGDGGQRRAEEASYYLLTATGAHAQAWETTAGGPLAREFVAELEHVQPGSNGRAELVPLLNRVSGRLGQGSVSKGDQSISIPIRLSMRPQSASGREPLEQAMGYAVQAFRDYLNEKVVSNVELIYFLAYDVWDGCLVYDGMVRGSIEHRLLDYVRRQFLFRDRLRSHYEVLDSIRTNGRAQPAGGHDEDVGRLGAAGRCFQDALAYVGKTIDPDPVRKLWYLGDLRNYPSEYRAYDRLLGLGSCLYIPVVGQFVPGSQRGWDTAERSPLGGVLMAACRRGYGLEPPGTTSHAEVRRRWEKAAGEFKGVRGKDLDGERRRQIIDADRGIAEAIADAILGPDGTGGAEVHNFLRCIGNVYAQRAQQRSRFRRLVHPQSVKGLARSIENESLKRDYAKQVEVIAARVEEAVELGPIDETATAWKDLIEAGVTEFYPPRTDRTKDTADLTKRYVTAMAWRDLRLDERLPGNPPRAQIARHELKDGSPTPGNPAERWESSIDERADEPDDLTSDRLENELARGEITEFHLRQVRRLIDDLRDFNEGPFVLLIQQLRALAPIDEYLRGIAEVEAVLASSQREEYLRHLAHTVQVWLLGVWVLESGGTDARVMDTAVPFVQKYLKSLPDIPRGHPTLGMQRLREKSERLSGDDIALFWGVAAAMHDLAEPVQQFVDWSKNFFNRYFGGWSLQIDRRTPLLLDVLHHTRYPFYKNAVTSLYPDRERNWLESVFYVELTNWVGHAISGALILVHEMEQKALTSRTTVPEDQRLSAATQPQMWKRVAHRLSPLLEHDYPEQGLLLPGYLAHGIAFSHVGDIKEHWRKQYERSGSEPKYLEDIAQKFKVLYEDFPLTYLLGLCEVLLEPTNLVLPELWIRDVSPDPYIGLSPFFVSKVEVLKPRSGEIGASATLPIAITLNLWLDGVALERSARFPTRSIIGGLKGKYSTRQASWETHSSAERDWVVWNHADYNTSWKGAEEKAGADSSMEHSGPAYWQVESGPLNVCRSAYEIVRMLRRLDDFKQHYRIERDLVIKFANMVQHDDETGEDEVYKFNLATTTTAKGTRK